jgi:hypothetical protein
MVLCYKLEAPFDGRFYKQHGQASPFLLEVEVPLLPTAVRERAQYSAVINNHFSFFFFFA